MRKSASLSLSTTAIIQVRFPFVNRKFARGVTFFVRGPLPGKMEGKGRVFGERRSFPSAYAARSGLVTGPSDF